MARIQKTKADVRAGVPIAKLANPRVVRGDQVGDHEGASFDVAQEGYERTWMEAFMGPVIDLDEDGRLTTSGSSADSIRARQAW